MDVYLIAPMPTFGRDRSMSETVMFLEERYTWVAAAGIATVAAFFGDDFGLRLCDELTEDVDFDDPSEVICISMNVAQVQRGLDIARRFRAMGRTVIMGGAHVSLAPEVFEGEADCLVIGEMESVAAQFVADLRDGQLKPKYRGSTADMSLSPMPRWDLYRNERAVSGVVQTSRGCPFECHFCDVIQYLGRAQRHKPNDAVLAEVQALYDFGYRHINLSDDNFTVYRQRTHSLLDALIAWNGHEGRDPVQFMTQASIDLSRDPDLLRKCNEAGLRDIFFGIETSDEEALKESRKRQNLRQDLVRQVETAVEAGVVVSAGMMVGFDADDLGAFERQFNFGMRLPVVNLRVTVLVAPVATPLYAQMKADGRLIEDENGVPSAGGDLWTNIEPLKMSRRQLAEGAVWLRQALSEPDNAIERFNRLAQMLGEAPQRLRRPLHRGRQNTGAVGSLKLMQAGARDAGGRRVIEAVRELSRARPEIAWDLASALSSFLNTYLAARNLSVDMEAAAPEMLAAATAS